MAYSEFGLHNTCYLSFTSSLFPNMCKHTLKVLLVVASPIFVVLPKKDTYGVVNYFLAEMEQSCHKGMLSS